MRPLRRVGVVLAAEVLVANGAACTLNFDQFEPGKGDGAAQGDSMGGGDGGPTDSPFDNPQQEACAPSMSCLGTATTCGSACNTTYQQCVQGCGNNGCRMTCRSNEQSCFGTCVSNCSDCTNAAGCQASFMTCDNAAHAGG